MVVTGFFVLCILIVNGIFGLSICLHRHIVPFWNQNNPGIENLLFRFFPESPVTSPQEVCLTVSKDREVQV